MSALRQRSGAPPAAVIATTSGDELPAIHDLQVSHGFDVGFIGFNNVSPDFTGFDWVLPAFCRVEMGFYSGALDFTGLLVGFH